MVDRTKVDLPDTYQFHPIGFVCSIFREKFGVPRQPGLAASIEAQVRMTAPYNDIQAFEDLNQCSHIWLQFVFHLNEVDQWKPRIKAPRLGGNKRLSVFASRSPNRPNPIGLSVVKYHGYEKSKGELYLKISGADLVNGTPVLDIKPYLPYTDKIETATNLLAPSSPDLVAVVFSSAAELVCQDYETQNLKQSLVEILQQDPRPKYHREEKGRVYGMLISNLNVQWIFENKVITVLDITPV